jgi:type IV secretion system protein VirD4
MDIFLAIIEFILSFIESVLKFFLYLLETLVGSSEDKRKYKASFSSSWSLLSPWNHGFNLTGNKNLTIKNSYQNALVSAATGMGKTTVVIIPSLFTTRGSFCTHDPSGEIFQKSSGFLKSKSYEIKVLNFSNPVISCGYNPLARTVTNSDIGKVSAMLVENSLGGTGAHKEPFWTNMAISLLTMLISVLKTQDLEYQNLYNVRHLLNQMGGNPEAVDTLFSNFSDDILFAEYKSFISLDDKVTSGVIATCKAALQIFNDPSVAKVTSYDNLNMQDFRRRPVALFIQNSVADQKYYSVLTSIFFEQYFSFIMSRIPEKQERDIFFLIDEASSLRLPTLQLAVSNVRKHRAGIMLIIQDFNQLVHNYGKHEAEAIRANCFAKLYFSGTSLETAKELEEILGKYEYKNKDKQKVVMPLMTNDQLRTMKANEAILICGHHKPIKATLRPYYKSLKFNHYSKLPPVRMAENNFTDNIPLLPLKSSSTSKSDSSGEGSKERK